LERGGGKKEGRQHKDGGKQEGKSTCELFPDELRRRTEEKRVKDAARGYRGAG